MLARFVFVFYILLVSYPSGIVFAARKRESVLSTQKVFTVDESKKIRKPKILTKEILLKLLVQRNNKIAKKHGEWIVIPDNILSLPPLPPGVAGVSVKISEPDPKNLGNIGQGGDSISAPI